MDDPKGRPIHEGQRVGQNHHLTGHVDTGVVKKIFYDENNNVQALIYWQGLRTYKAHWPDDITVDWRMDGGQT